MNCRAQAAPPARSGREQVAAARQLLAAGDGRATTLAMLAGFQAFEAGATMEGCPFTTDEADLHTEWMDGWRTAEVRAREPAPAVDQAADPDPANAVRLPKHPGTTYIARSVEAMEKEKDE